MKLNKSRIQTITKKKYLEYIKLFPNLQETKTKEYTTLILSFAAMTIFGIFAINPTITTIIKLQKTYEDAKFANQKIDEKIENLGILYDKYNSLGDDLKRINDAIPRSPNTSLLLGQLQALAQKEETRIRSLQTQQVQQASAAILPQRNSSYGFLVEVDGSYAQLSSFLRALLNYERIVAIESASIGRDKDDLSLLVMTIKGKAHFR